MAAINLYLDEDVHTFIADAVRRRGWEALTTEEAGRRGATDADQLAFARSAAQSSSPTTSATFLVCTRNCLPVESRTPALSSARRPTLEGTSARCSISSAAPPPLKRCVIVSSTSATGRDPLHRGSAPQSNRDAILLAREHGLILLIDDLAGRRAAEAWGVSIIGSAGALSLAKQAGLLPLVQPALDDLLRAGLRLSASLHRQILTDAGEA